MISCFDIESELSKFVREGECCLAIEPDNPKMLKDAILKIYKSKDKGKRYGKNARKYVINIFSRSIMTSQIINKILQYK